MWGSSGASNSTLFHHNPPTDTNRHMNEWSRIRNRARRFIQRSLATVARVWNSIGVPADAVLCKILPRLPKNNIFTCVLFGASGAGRRRRGSSRSRAGSTHVPQWTSGRARRAWRHNASSHGLRPVSPLESTISQRPERTLRPRATAGLNASAYVQTLK